MNTTTGAQRHNARQDKIWAEAKRLRTQTRFNASSRTPAPNKAQHQDLVGSPHESPDTTSRQATQPRHIYEQRCRSWDIEHGKQPRTSIIERLKYIADSPNAEHGGFHPEAIKTAKDAICAVNHADKLAERLHELAQNPNSFTARNKALKALAAYEDAQ